MVKLCCNLFPFSEDWCNTIQCIIAFIALVLAIFTVWYGKCEYDKMVKHKQCEVFAQYNERYENSENIQKVVKYCTIKAEKQEDIPTTHDKEMFLRFFEELEMMIQEEYLTEDKVGNYFAYYFLVIWNDETFFWDKEMCGTYGTKEKAQKRPEWKAACHLFERLEKKWYSNEIRVYKFPNATDNNFQSIAESTSE